MALYAPIIGNVVNAFIKGRGIKIEYTHNRAVDLNDVIGLSLLIKNLDSSEIGNINQDYSEENKKTNNIFTFDISANITLTAGNYYKFQIAYVKTDGTIGTYSTVAFGRYLGEKAPELKIYDLNTKNEISTQNIVLNTGSYEGKCFFEELIDETPDVYKFDLIDSNEKVIQTTDWQSYYYNKPMTFIIYEELIDAVYKLKYSVKTISGYEPIPACSQIIKNVGLDPTFTKEDNIKISENEGVVVIEFNTTGLADNETYELLRQERFSNTWEHLTYLTLKSNQVVKWKDYAIEHNKEYRYGVRNYILEGEKAGVHSEIVFTDYIKSEYEYMYLSDSERMLTIKYDPKVSSFKNTILEQKIDTIGNQNPFFFRNGNVKYKEFPINGLISYLMDEQSEFITKAELGIIADDSLNRIETMSKSSEVEYSNSTNLDSNNIAYEREFKLKVLDWLTNGKPKLFRSPTEGVYVVRLMNTSLAPNDTLGRMLHSFSTTAYECAAADYKTMTNLNVVKNSYDIKTEPRKVEEMFYTIVVGDSPSNGTTILQDGPYSNITYVSASPTTETYITLDGKKYYNPTGYFSTPFGVKFKKIEFNLEGNEYSTITYSKEVETENTNESTKASAFKDTISGRIVLFTLMADKEEGVSLDSDFINNTSKYYNITCEGTGTVTLTINNTPIDIKLSDGNKRSYNNLTNITGIKLTKGATAHIYCYTKAEKLPGTVIFSNDFEEGNTNELS